MILEKRILVAEDDRTTRDAWSELIVAWGYKVKTAENGEAALLEAAAYDPHILLLDLNLPRKNGLQVLPKLNERARSGGARDASSWPTVAPYFLTKLLK